MNDLDNSIICPECPGVYSPSRIKATFGDESLSLAELYRETPLSPQPTIQKRPGFFESLTSKRSAEAAPRHEAGSVERPTVSPEVLMRLRPWSFTCPAGHSVDANRGSALPIAVLGEGGASKSHFLPGLIWELETKRSLGSLGLTLREGIYTNDLVKRVAAVFEDHEVLDSTLPGKLLGPYSYRLSLGRGETQDRHSLLLFDIAGEDLQSVIRIAENAAYILLCKGIIILIDPVGILKTAFDTHGVDERGRLAQITRVRKGITRIADMLEEVHQRQSQQLGIPTVFCLAKADSVEWDYPWMQATEDVLQSTKSGHGLRETLEQSSDQTRELLNALGLGRLTEEISERFSSTTTRYCLASATSEMPVPDTAGTKRTWVEPDPNGAALALLHLLEMIGIATQTSSTLGQEGR
jgi:hypothetical protein